MTEFGPSLSTSLFDRDIHRYDILPFRTDALTLNQLIGTGNLTFKPLFDPTGIQLNVPSVARRESFYATKVIWKRFCATQLQNVITGLPVSWESKAVAWGQAFGFQQITYDGERPPLFSAAETDELYWPRMIKRINIIDLQATVVFNFNSMTDVLNVAPDPAGPHYCFLGLELTIEILKNPKHIS